MPSEENSTGRDFRPCAMVRIPAAEYRQTSEERRITGRMSFSNSHRLGRPACRTALSCSQLTQRKRCSRSRPLKALLTEVTAIKPTFPPSSQRSCEGRCADLNLGAKCLEGEIATGDANCANAKLPPHRLRSKQTEKCRTPKNTDQTQICVEYTFGSARPAHASSLKTKQEFQHDNQKAGDSSVSQSRQQMVIPKQSHAGPPQNEALGQRSTPE